MSFKVKQVQDITNNNENNNKNSIEEGIKNNIEIELPYIYYLGYNVTMENNSDKVNLETFETENGFVGIKVLVYNNASNNVSNNVNNDANNNAKIEVKYTGTILMKMSGIVSLFTVLISILVILRKVIKRY